MSIKNTNIKKRDLDLSFDILSDLGFNLEGDISNDVYLETGNNEIENLYLKLESLEKRLEEIKEIKLTPSQIDQILSSEIFTIQRGLPGPSGESILGPRGPQGPMGKTGAQGIPGIQGPIGPPGLRGLPGKIGPQGPMGLPGVIGPQGPMGYPGPQGKSGKDGKDGVNGQQGPQGEQGEIRTKYHMNLKKMIIPEYGQKYGETQDFIISLNRNQGVNNKRCFNTFYLNVNGIDINTNIQPDPVSQYYVDFFSNIYDQNQTTGNDDNVIDGEYFPLNTIPQSILCEVKRNRQIIISDIRYCMLQTMNSDETYFFEENHQLHSSIVRNNGIQGFYYRQRECMFTNVELELSFEIHHYIPNSQFMKKNKNHKSYPYVSQQQNQSNHPWSPNNTCVTKPQKVIIQKNVGKIDRDIVLTVPQNIDTDVIMLYVKINVPENTKNRLKYYNLKGEETYGFIPFSSFSIDFIKKEL